MNRLVRYCLRLLLATAFLAAAPSQTYAQDNLGEALNAIGKDYADNYTQPITDALGGGLNAGLFRTASFDGTGLVPVIDLYVGVSAMGTFTSGSSSSFQLANEEIETTTPSGGTRTLIAQYPGEMPTVFGEEESPGEVILTDKQTGSEVDRVALPAGLINTSIAPLAVPQIGVGTAFGTDVQLRYLPSTNISDYGSVSLTGLAVRHSLSQYIPLSPVALAVQGSWQQLSLSSSTQDDIVEGSGWALNAQVSKSVPVLPITFYGGLQYEKYTVDVNYTFETPGGDTSDISLSQDAQNNFRALAGVSISLLVARLNVDYALGANNVVSAGLGVTL
jgi:hypothetical protein